MEIPEILPKQTYKRTTIFRNDNLQEAERENIQTSQNVTISKNEFNDIVNKHGKPLLISSTSPFMRAYLEKGFIVLRYYNKGLNGTDILYFSSTNINRIGKIYKLYI